MTVIAIKDNILAADSRSTCGDVIVSDTTDKLYTLDDTKYAGDVLLACGLAGSAKDTEIFLDHLSHPDYPRQPIRHECWGIVVGTKYNYVLEPHSMYMIQYNKKQPLAVGSGADFALSAMALGLDAKQACKHATKFQIHCGGRIRSIDFNRKVKTAPAVGVVSRAQIERAVKLSKKGEMK